MGDRGEPWGRPRLSWYGALCVSSRRRDAERADINEKTHSARWRGQRCSIRRLRMRPGMTASKAP